MCQTKGDRAGAQIIFYISTVFSSNCSSLSSHPFSKRSAAFFLARNILKYYSPPQEHFRKPIFSKMNSAILSLVFCLLVLVNSETLTDQIHPENVEVSRRKILSCPGVCRLGKNGFTAAKKECGRSRCGNKKVKCTVQVCATSSGLEGFKCDCPVSIESCPEICRSGSIGRLMAQTECKQKPTCSSTRTKCKVVRCITDGRKGAECACPFPKETPEEDE